MKKTPSNDTPRRETGRVYLLHTRSVERGDGGRVVYPAGFYSLDLEPAAAWVADGLAVPEAEWEARVAAAAAAPPITPVMHPAGPKAPPASAAAPAGNLWAQGAKGSRIPAVPAPAPAAITESAGVQTPAGAAKEEIRESEE